MTVRLSLDGLGRLASDLANIDHGLRYVGERAVEVILAEGRTATGGDLVLSRFAQGRVRLDAKAETRGTTLIVRGVPGAPWTIIESGSKKSAWLEPRPGSRKRLLLPDGGIRSRVTHGRVAGRHAFTRAASRISAQAPGWLDTWVTDQIRKAA